MTKINTKLEGKQHAVVGTLNQAKGVARETLGKVMNDPQMQLSGKKDQVVGTLQKNVGDSWAYRNKNTVAGLTLLLAIIGAMVYYMNRNAPTTISGSQYENHYTY